MGAEKSHIPLSSDPRIYPSGPIKGWEEGIESESIAKMYYEHLQEGLEKHSKTPFDQYFEVLLKSDGPIGTSVYRKK